MRRLGDLRVEVQHLMSHPHWQGAEKPFRPIPMRPIWAASPFLDRIISGGHPQTPVKGVWPLLRGTPSGIPFISILTRLVPGPGLKVASCLYRSPVVARKGRSRISSSGNFGRYGGVPLA
jgi:hypothetical protein